MVGNIVGAPQVFPLGRTHGYSAALGYAILARTMEVADGKPWDDIMRDRLFAPLGLTSTNSWHEQVAPGRMATGHLIRSLAEGPITAPVPYLPRAIGPGGNVTSTAREVLTMAQTLLDNGRALDRRRAHARPPVRDRGPAAGPRRRSRPPPRPSSRPCWRTPARNPVPPL
jgi:CubicO group peptidase (beta-lactamase class C family)